MLKWEETIVKKLIAIIMILMIILIGMFVYKKIAISTHTVDMEEIENIENYLKQIYMWKEVTREALPYFEEINQANENWIWEVVKKNLEEYEVTKEQIQTKAIELFGENFQKQFPKEGTSYLPYDEQNNLYYAEEISLDQQEDSFCLNQIQKHEDGYEVEIIEYIEDYSQELEQGNDTIILRNIAGDEIEKVPAKEESQIQELVKNKIDRFQKKKIILKKEKEKLYVQKVF